jgi:hypothetical protein
MKESNDKKRVFYHIDSVGSGKFTLNILIKKYNHKEIIKKIFS